MAGRRRRGTCSLRYAVKHPAGLHYGSMLCYLLDARAHKCLPSPADMQAGMPPTCSCVYSSSLPGNATQCSRAPAACLPFVGPHTRLAAQLQVDKVVNRPAAPDALQVHVVVGMILHQSDSTAIQLS